jgi:hypothetical protein
MDKMQLAQLVDMENPSSVFEEVKYNFIHHYPVSEFKDVRITFRYFNDLFDGKYPGYRECNTRFHDKLHTTDALMAISRLIDGYNIDTDTRIPVHEVKIALMATILHDTGYIQTDEETEGTGAQFTLSHVKRSMGFIERYFRKRGLSDMDIRAAQNMVSCTGLDTDIAKVHFASETEHLLGLMLGTADLIGQMSSRTYLERLMFLYHEFKEGQISNYNSELELLEKTLGFYEVTKVRLARELKAISKYFAPHFNERYGLSKDLYEIAISRQMGYLGEILRQDKEEYRNKLRRLIRIVDMREVRVDKNK